MSQLWDFLEENMHHYSSDSRIFQIDVLCRFQDEELTDEQIVEHGLTEMSTCDAHAEELRLTDICFQEALENFTQKEVAKGKYHAALDVLLTGKMVKLSDDNLKQLGCEGCENEMIIHSIEQSCISLYSEKESDVIYDVPIELVEIPALDVIRIKVAFGEQLCKAVNDGYYKEDDDDEYFPVY